MIEEAHTAFDQNNLGEVNRISSECIHWISGIKDYKEIAKSHLSPTSMALFELEIDSVYYSRAKEFRGLSKKFRSLSDSIAAENEHLWVKADGGRSKFFGTGGEQAKDCATRAVAIGTDKCYRKTWMGFDSLIPSGHDPDGGVSLISISTMLFREGWSFHPVKELSVADFAKDGKVAILNCKLMDKAHAVAVKDGMIHDMWNSGGWLVNMAFYPKERKMKQGELIVTLDWIKNQAAA